jgi:hypothetical protein
MSFVTHRVTKDMDPPPGAFPDARQARWRR